MRIAIVGKYPPIQGGTSRQTYLAAHALASRGHDIVVLTNADEVEYSVRQMFITDDESRLEGDYGTGSIKVFRTAPLGRNDYVPWAQPFASKLFGLGVEVLGSIQCDLIVGWYMEPYGLTAAQLSAALGIPLVLRHAGSDIGRLARHPNLRPAYDWAFRASERILTAPQALPILLELGVDEKKCHMTGGNRMPGYFSEAKTRLDLEAVTTQAESWFPEMGLGSLSQELLARGLASLPARREELPTIGVYGKVGRSKGSYDLLDVLDAMAAEGREFHLLAISGGQTPVFQAYLEYLGTKRALLKRTTTLPFLAPWRVPEFLAHCDAACFLENNFAIRAHSPKVAQEILASGTALICSGEIADKQFFKQSLVDGRNYYRVSEPSDQRSLRAVLEDVITDQSRREDIACRGLVLARHLDESVASADGFADAIESVAASLVR